ncbi:MAG TPA: undecaprenyl-diphosphatase UppP [Bryobacteraceae bacterium]|nr:undecaprenyl-diphosphatase UppP [Bryobacteraceae bacterium]
MPLLHAIILGIIQGLTEFLPVSSSAHLALIPWLLGWNDQGLSFDIALHVGTVLAVIVYFFRDWIQVIAEGFGISIGSDPAIRRNPKLLWLLVLGSIPAGIAGLLVKDLAENVWRNNQYLIGSMLILVGLFMWWADRQGSRRKDLGNVSATDSLSIGAAQALALVPGVSRSGITICAGLLRNLDRETAARFSFLLATPAIAGAAAKDAWDLMRHGGGMAGIPHDLRMALLVGVIVSAITGALTIQFFLNFLRRRSLSFFVWYRVIFGIIVIALATFFRYHGG